MLDEVEGVAALDAEELAVDAGLVAIVAANDFFIADAQGGSAAVGTMRTNSADVIHFPRPGLVAIGSAGERAYGANVDAGPAFVALQMVVHVGDDVGDNAAVAHAQGIHAHAFIADADAAVAEDAAGRVEVHNRRPLLLRNMDLHFRKAAFAGAVAEDHVLQFALAALVADGAIEGMIR